MPFSIFFLETTFIICNHFNLHSLFLEVSCSFPDRFGGFRRYTRFSETPFCRPCRRVFCWIGTLQMLFPTLNVFFTHFRIYFKFLTLLPIFRSYSHFETLIQNLPLQNCFTARLQSIRFILFVLCN